MLSSNPFERAAVPAALTEPPAEVTSEATPARHEDVVARVRELLGKYPSLGSRQLFEHAIDMHPELQMAGFRSFHARYVLPLKREQARVEGRLPRPRATSAKRPRRSRTAAADVPAAAALDTPQVRARIREVLLRLARRVAIAESRADLVDALAGVEDGVDEVIRAFQAGATAESNAER